MGRNCAQKSVPEGSQSATTQGLTQSVCAPSAHSFFLMPHHKMKQASKKPWAQNRARILVQKTDDNGWLLAVGHPTQDDMYFYEKCDSLVWPACFSSFCWQKTVWERRTGWCGRTATSPQTVTTREWTQCCRSEKGTTLTLSSICAGLENNSNPLHKTVWERRTGWCGRTATSPMTVTSNKQATPTTIMSDGVCRLFTQGSFSSVSGAQAQVDKAPGQQEPIQRALTNRRPLLPWPHQRPDSWPHTAQRL
jgi:hypothetical protein